MYPDYTIVNKQPYHSTCTARNDQDNYLSLNSVSQAGAGNIGQQAMLQDYGKRPLVVDIEKVTKLNHTFRTALWTGEKFQVTVMSINVGEDIGLEVHPTTDQFIRIEEGQGLVQMGDSKDRLDFVVNAYEDYAIVVPAGKWHNLTNTGNKPLKAYVIYAPPEHPFGTVHRTKSDAMASE
ncbi:cupin domain-containing protein [Paenibacillus peoriae]|uniref:cupin domain-containing protein n=1 Tax=Paenibacillus peoriae TaxID=59893 RepID=UPI001EE435A2|nr:cupin domain-containing protein [Paenibacillus polymyxa]